MYNTLLPILISVLLPFCFCFSVNSEGLHVGLRVEASTKPDAPVPYSVVAALTAKVNELRCSIPPSGYTNCVAAPDKIGVLETCEVPISLLTPGRFAVGNTGGTAICTDGTWKLDNSTNIGQNCRDIVALGYPDGEYVIAIEGTSPTALLYVECMQLDAERGWMQIRPESMDSAIASTYTCDIATIPSTGVFSYRCNPSAEPARPSHCGCTMHLKYKIPIMKSRVLSISPSGNSVCGNVPFPSAQIKVSNSTLTTATASGTYNAALCAEDNCKVEAAFVLPTPTEINLGNHERRIVATTLTGYGSCIFNTQVTFAIY